MLKKTALLGAFLGAMAWFTPAPAQARDLDSCQTAWSQAVRSYLTKNRKAGPDGKVPKDIDEAELAAQAWAATFRSACQLEAGGQKAEARVEAAAIGVEVLAKLDPRGCARFLEYYMQSTRGNDICSAAGTMDSAELRRQIESSIPRK